MLQADRDKAQAARRDDSTRRFSTYYKTKSELGREVDSCRALLKDYEAS